MTETKTNPLFHLMPSLTDVAFLYPLVYLFSGLDGVRTMLADGDTGWHIRTGEWILAHGAVPRQDMFSFTKPGAPFFAWEWLWDVCFAWIHGRWGLGGVALVSIFVLCLTSALLYKLVLAATVRAGRENPLVAIVLTGLAMGGASMHWLARPHLFSMLFLLIFVAILERARGAGFPACSRASARPEEPAESRLQPARLPHNEMPSARLLWLLPPITILWVNVHAGFLVGVAMVGLYGIGSLVNAAVAPGARERIAHLRSAVPYFAAAAGCALASLVNPYTYRLHAHIWEYLNDRFPLNHVSEYQAANFRWGAAPLIEAMLVLAVSSAIWYGLRRQFVEVVVLMAWAHMSLVIARNVPIFMVVAAPFAAPPVLHWLRALGKAPIAGWLRSVFANFEEIGEELVAMERPWRVHAVSAAVLLLLAGAISAPGAGPKFKPEFDPHTFPAGALAALDNPGQRIFTYDQWGDYLIYELSPRGGKVYIDGRSDLYGDKFCLEAMDVMSVKYDWEKTLARYGVDTILISAGSPLAGAIKESRHWRVRYDDGLAIVFRPAPSAPGTNLQVSAGTASGLGGRDLPVTESARVNPKDHEFQQQPREGVNP
ncbi:MAG TPA: hypothetical protein VGR73_01045 [Bryobacteraceae bacterium]|nr:hypothetical protein [Bryobacteraceae bacterium]